MATIVREAKDPWWAPLATNVLGGLVGGLVDDWRQREKNKKEAAFMGELARIFGEDEQGNATTPTLTTPQLPAQSASQGTGQGLLNAGQGLLSANEPEGYNSNGWASAFHNTSSPLSLFDNATAGLLGMPANTSASAPATTTPTPIVRTATPPTTAATSAVVPPTQSQQSQGISTPMAKFVKAMQLLETSRFGMLGADVGQKLVTPFMMLNEAARQEQMRRDAANAVMNARSSEDMLNQLYGTTIQGITPQSILNSAQERWKYETPYLQQYTQNTGATTRYGGFNPRTGTFTQAGEYQNTLTPQEAASIAQQEAARRENAREFNVRLGYNREGRTWYQRYKNTELQMKVNEIQPGSSYLDNDGNWYVLRRDGTPVLRSKLPGITPQQNQQLEHYGKQEQLLVRELEQAESSKRVNAAKGLDTTEDDKKINEIRTRLNDVRKKSEQIIRSTAQPKQGSSIGSMMLGNINVGRISKNGEWGNNRGDHSHKGTDYPAPAGTPITILPNMGVTFKVIEARKSDSYGNTVVLETIRAGKKVHYRMAHMKDGSVSVKKGDIVNAGDVIGQVGSTGHSTGNHLHLEVSVNGQLVDPEVFFRDYGDTITISQEKYNEFLQKLEKGLAQYEDGRIIPNREALHEYIRSKGYQVPVSSMNVPPQTPPVSPDVTPTPQVISPDVKLQRTTAATPSTWDEQMPALIGFTGAGGNLYNFTIPEAYTNTQNGLGSSDIPASPEIPTPDSNSQTGEQRALDALNGVISGDNYRGMPDTSDLLYRGPFYENPIDDSNIIPIPEYAPYEHGGIIPIPNYHPNEPGEMQLLGGAIPSQFARWADWAERYNPQRHWRQFMALGQNNRYPYGSY
ncbi:MAG: M23 family metallopeptidase [Synergistaceae bacterium]|nr:M23 family metallopeptidase [Synergistaceae bacterium]